MAYIIDTYNRWDKWDRKHAVFVFTVNDVPYAIKNVNLEWGQPQLPMRIEQETQNQPPYYIYGSLEEAIEFAKHIKSIN